MIFEELKVFGVRYWRMAERPVFWQTK